MNILKKYPPAECVHCFFVVKNLRCQETLEAGYQCTCDVDGVITPLNGTDCISEYNTNSDAEFAECANTL